MAAPDISALETMPHLTQKTDEAKKEIEAKMDGDHEEKQRQADEDDPKTKELYTFDFKYTDGHGRIWRGQFTNKALNMLDRQVVGNLQAQWQGGRPHSSIDPNIAELNFMLAHMEVTLKKEGRPNWAIDIRTLFDLDLVNALYEEVSAHESTFHRYGKGPAGSEKKV